MHARLGLRRLDCEISRNFVKFSKSMGTFVHFHSDWRVEKMYPGTFGTFVPILAPEFLRFFTGTLVVLGVFRTSKPTYPGTVGTFVRISSIFYRF